MTHACDPDAMQVRVGLTVLLLTGCCSQTEPPPVPSPWVGRLDLEALTSEILSQLERRGLEAIEPAPRELEGRLIELEVRQRVDFELGWLASEGAWWLWVPPRILADLIQAGTPGLDWEESQLMVRSSLLRVVGEPIVCIFGVEGQGVRVPIYW